MAIATVLSSQNYFHPARRLQLVVQSLQLVLASRANNDAHRTETAMRTVAHAHQAGVEIGIVTFDNFDDQGFEILSRIAHHGYRVVAGKLYLGCIGMLVGRIGHSLRTG